MTATARPFDWRPVVPADAPALARLYAESARRLGPLVYSPAQVAAWSGWPEADPDAFRHYVLDADTWVAQAADSAILGFCGIDADGDSRELHSLYVHAAATRHGIGTEMLRRTLARADASGVRRIAAWATPLSRPVFLRAGFEWTRTVVEPYAGVLFERYRVERG